MTVAYRHLVAKSRHVGDLYTAQWLGGVERIFEEENVHYCVDPKGGVHFRFDHEFAHVTAAAMAALREPRYANFSDAFNKAMTALAEAPPDGKGAIRSTFTAIEGLVCLMFPDLRRLAAGAAGRLGPLIIEMYPGDRRAQEAAGELVASFRSWIDAAQQYRHEEGTPDIVAQPPLALAVYLVSSGASHLRWLAELDVNRVRAGSADAAQDG